MLRKLIAPAFAVLAIAAVPVAAQGAPDAPRAEIPFANHGGVENWRAVSDREIWFEGSHRRWYRARLFTPAFDLQTTEHIGIDAGPSGTLDRFGAIYVHGRRYTFVSFERMPGPPPKKASKRR